MPLFDVYIMVDWSVQHGAGDGVLTVFGLLTDAQKLTQQHRKMCGLRTNDGCAGFNRRSQLQARSPA
jgi:hypothetical protein